MRNTFVFLLSLVMISTAFSQKSNTSREKGFQFNVQGIAFMVGEKDETTSRIEELDMGGGDSYLFGVNIEAHYRFNENIIVGLGTGYETINQPNISYIPVYISLRSSIGAEKLEAPIFRVDVGTQFGDLARTAPLFRIGVGYRIPVYKELCVNIEGILTYQGLRKEFVLEPGVVQYYNMNGFGISAGFEL